jgi:hypothetical protein
MKLSIFGTLTVGMALFMVGCAVPYSSGTYDKKKIDPRKNAEVRIAIDCSIESVDPAGDLFSMVPHPDTSFNESACKALADRVIARFSEGEYGTRFKSSSLEYVSIGRAYRSKLLMEKEQLDQYLTDKPECDYTSDVAIEDLTSCQVDVMNQREKLGYLKSKPIVLIDKSSSLSEEAIHDVGDFNSTYGWTTSNSRSRGVLGADFEAVEVMNMWPNQYLLHVQAGGLHLVSEESMEKMLTRKAATSALLMTTCMLGACIYLDGDYNPTYELSAVLVNSEGQPVYGSVAHFTYEPENSQNETISMLVEELMPLDVFEDAGDAAVNSEDEEDGSDEPATSPVLREA